MLGVYAFPDTPGAVPFTEGLTRLGIPFRWRSHADYRRGEVEKFNQVFITGLRGKGRWILEDYTAKGIPVMVMDYGYLKRTSGMATWATGHWQLGLNQLNGLPGFPCPPDRFESLGIPLKPRQTGDTILVCGQHAGDPSHGLDQAGVRDWAIDTIKALSERTDRAVVWRPHPDSPIELPGVATDTGALDFTNVHAVVTISSNAGLEAIIHGVPVFCDAIAPYARLANVGLDAIDNPHFPTDVERLSYLYRLAYAQWTWDELREGLGQRFLMDAIAGVRPEVEPIKVAPPPAPKRKRRRG